MTDHPEAGVSAITDHAYRPRDHWWDLCEVCGIAAPAHSRAEVAPFGYCDSCGAEVKRAGTTLCAVCDFVEGP